MGRLLYFIHRAYIVLVHTEYSTEQTYFRVGIEPVAAGARKVFVADRARRYAYLYGGLCCSNIYIFWGFYVL